jgi:hypothetical protein
VASGCAPLLLTRPGDPGQPPCQEELGLPELLGSCHHRLPDPLLLEQLLAALSTPGPGPAARLGHLATRRRWREGARASPAQALQPAELAAVLELELGLPEEEGLGPGGRRALLEVVLAGARLPGAQRAEAALAACLRHWLWRGALPATALSLLSCLG